MKRLYYGHYNILKNFVFARLKCCWISWYYEENTEHRTRVSLRNKLDSRVSNYEWEYMQSLVRYWCSTDNPHWQLYIFSAISNRFVQNLIFIFTSSLKYMHLIKYMAKTVSYKNRKYSSSTDIKTIFLLPIIFNFQPCNSQTCNSLPAVTICDTSRCQLARYFTHRHSSNYTSKYSSFERFTIIQNRSLHLTPNCAICRSYY